MALKKFNPTSPGQRAATSGTEARNMRARSKSTSVMSVISWPVS